MLVENQSYPEDPRVRREATALIEAGYQVTVIAPGRRGQAWRENVTGVQVYRFPAPPGGTDFLGYLWEYGYSVTATFVLSLLVFLRRGFDVVHAHNPPDLFVFIAAFYKLFGKRFIYDHHDLAPEMYYARFEGSGNRWVYRILIALEKLSYRVADHVIATNASYKAVALQRGRVPEERVTIVRNGPELQGLKLVAPDAQLRLKAEIIIGYVGAMGVQDGLDYLLRALRYLVYDLGRTDVFCVLIGKGDARAHMKQLTAQLGLDDYVWFTGWVTDDELVRYLSTADICVDPDPSNPFNDRCTMIKMTEYMALAKPIVAFDLPEHRYTAQGAALYAKSNDELEFARALVQLMDDPAQRRAMGASGRQRIESELAWHYSVPHLLSAYHKVLQAQETERKYSNDAPEISK
jgi:glycosyltransferase involved in cell wall biosynthesis